MSSSTGQGGGGGAGVPGVGRTVSLFADLEAAKIRARNSRLRASEMEFQALEVERKGRRDERILRRRGAELKGEQVGGFIKAGVELEGSPLFVMEDTFQQIEEESIARARLSQTEAETLRRGARLTRKNARKILQAETIAAFGKFAGGTASDISRLNDPNTGADTSRESSGPRIKKFKRSEL